MNPLTVCVVIDARDCVELPSAALLALKQQTFGEPFDVLVLAAPGKSNDWLDRLPPGVRAILSPSNDVLARLAALKECRADLILFMSADKVGGATWIERLSHELRDAEVAAVGGTTPTGCVLDREGVIQPTLQPDLDHLCFPGSNLVPIVDDWNCGFRVTALWEVGADLSPDFGDLMWRLSNAGFLIRPSARVQAFPIRTSGLPIPQLDTGLADRNGLTPRPLNIALISRAYPPNVNDGLATLTTNLAHSLVSRGHWVHVVTQAPREDEAEIVSDPEPTTTQVSYESGVWVHQLPTSDVARTAVAREVGMPQDRWNWSATALAEVNRIDQDQSVDVVEAPISRGQGIAVLQDGRFPLVTSLQTSLQLWINTSGRELSKKWWRNVGTPMLAVETQLLLKSNALRAISRAIKVEIATEYSVTLDDDRTVVAPLGMADIEKPAAAPVSATEPQAEPEVVILFVGRFENRKGIDVLLDSIPGILQRAPMARFVLIGTDKPDAKKGNQTYREVYQAKPEFAACLDRVEFRGEVSDDERNEAIASADLFVGPSRFESFGLVFVEAMRFGVPVIGCDAGGMPEVINAGVTGLVVPPGDREALADAVVELVTNPERRRLMSDAARRDFLLRFSLDAMAIQSEEIYQLAIHNYGS